MMNTELFFVEVLDRYDPVLVHIIGQVRRGILLTKEEVAKCVGEAYRAKVERIYWSRKEVSGDFLKLGAEIDLDPLWWEWEMPLVAGDRALVFVDKGSGYLNQGTQLLLEDIDNVSYGIRQIYYPFPPYSPPTLWKDESVSPLIRAHARPDPKRGYTTAIRLDVIEADIQASIDAIQRGYTKRKVVGEPKTDYGLIQDGCALYYRLEEDPTAASEITAFIYHRARPDEIVAQRHAVMAAHLQTLDGPFGLQGIAPPPAPVFADGGYWQQTLDESRAVVMSGWYAFRGVRPLEDKAVDDDNFHYKFDARDARLDYKKLIHDDFKRAIAASGGYRAIWNYSRYGIAYRRGYLEYEDAERDEVTDLYPIATEEYEKLCADKSLDVDGRNNIYTLYPAQYWDAELCQRALGHGPDEVVRRLQDKAPRAERLGDGVYLVLNDDPGLRYDDFLALNNRYKPLLGLK
jgi:hypothetical protein